MTRARDELLASIAQTMADYRLGEIPPMTPSHVERWVSQFDSNQQEAIILEIDGLLKQNFLSRQRARYLIRAMLRNEAIFGSDPKSMLPHIHFLRLQRRGGSQAELLQLVDEALQEMFGWNINSCGTQPTTYIYIDDCVFTGNRVREDFAEWFSNDVRGKRLFLVFFAVHESGLQYALNYLLPKANQFQVSVKRMFDVIYLNETKRSRSFDCYWPRRCESNQYVQTYIDGVIDYSTKRGVVPRLFRPSLVPTQGRGFVSEESRSVLECALLRAGSFIVSLAKNPDPLMRPLGYERLNSLGFGSTFIMFRNISNTSPLALWYGDPKMPPTHPFGKWYPLFPRRSNEETVRVRNSLTDGGPEYVWPEDEGWANDNRKL